MLAPLALALAARSTPAGAQGNAPSPGTTPAAANGTPVLTLNLDEGQGTSTTALGAPKPLALVDTEWVKPGFQSPAALRFNGTTSRLDLPLKITPAGPFSLKLAARPKSYGGLFFADVGGMTAGTTPAGLPFFMRIGESGKWVHIAGNNALPTDSWTQLRYVWDGAAIRLEINGQQVAQAPCPAKFSPSKAALGYNPWSTGSQFYNGDIDQVQLSTLPPSS